MKGAWAVLRLVFHAFQHGYRRSPETFARLIHLAFGVSLAVAALVLALGEVSRMGPTPTVARPEKPVLQRQAVENNSITLGVVQERVNNLQKEVEQLKAQIADLERRNEMLEKAAPANGESRLELMEYKVGVMSERVTELFWLLVGSIGGGGVVISRRALGKLRAALLEES